MPQFFIDGSFETGDRIEIAGSDAHHIIDVLRLKPGDRIVLSNGKGRSFNAEIISTSSKRVSADINEEVVKKSSVEPPSLAFAVIKHDRSEWIIQKAVELGCRKIMPFFSGRTVPTYRSAGKRCKRWQEIALAAAKQSGMPFIPRVEEPVDFGLICKLFSNFDKTILLWEGEQERSIESCVSGLVSHVLLIIGPEGGFEAAEIERARAAGAVTACMGRQILRVETAAVAALTIAQYERGNMGI